MLKTLLSSVVLLALVAGCQTSKKPEGVPMGSSSLTDVSPTPSAPIDRTPTLTPSPVSDQPISDGSATTITPGGGKKYTVKKGDTLWGIASKSYGDGKQYTKIVSANPGVSPQTLKVGQQIVIP